MIRSERAYVIRAAPRGVKRATAAGTTRRRLGPRRRRPVARPAGDAKERRAPNRFAARGARGTGGVVGGGVAKRLHGAGVHQRRRQRNVVEQRRRTFLFVVVATSESPMFAGKNAALRVVRDGRRLSSPPRCANAASAASASVAPSFASAAHAASPARAAATRAERGERVGRRRRERGEARRDARTRDGPPAAETRRRHAPRARHGGGADGGRCGDGTTSSRRTLAAQRLQERLPPPRTPPRGPTRRDTDRDAARRESPIPRRLRDQPLRPTIAAPRRAARCHLVGERVRRRGGRLEKDFFELFEFFVVRVPGRRRGDPNWLGLLRARTERRRRVANGHRPAIARPTRRVQALLQPDADAARTASARTRRRSD